MQVGGGWVVVDPPGQKQDTQAMRPERWNTARGELLGQRLQDDWSLSDREAGKEDLGSGKKELGTKCCY